MRRKRKDPTTFRPWGRQVTSRRPAFQAGYGSPCGPGHLTDRVASHARSCKCQSRASGKLDTASLLAMTTALAALRPRYGDAPHVGVANLPGEPLRSSQSRGGQPRAVMAKRSCAPSARTRWRQAVHEQTRRARARLSLPAGRRGAGGGHRVVPGERLPPLVSPGRPDEPGAVGAVRVGGSGGQARWPVLDCTVETSLGSFFGYQRPGAGDRLHLDLNRSGHLARRIEFSLHPDRWPAHGQPRDPFGGPTPGLSPPCDVGPRGFDHDRRVPPGCPQTRLHPPRAALDEQHGDPELPGGVTRPLARDVGCWWLRSHAGPCSKPDTGCLTALRFL